MYLYPVEESYTPVKIGDRYVSLEDRQYAHYSQWFQENRREEFSSLWSRFHAPYTGKRVTILAIGRHSTSSHYPMYLVHIQDHGIGLTDDRLINPNPPPANYH